MAQAIRTATRIQDQDDVNVTPGAGTDGYALTWDNATSRFVLAAGAAGSGTAGRVAQWAAGGATLANANLVAPANVLTLAAGGAYTLTIPASGTVALLATANIFTAAQTIGPTGTTGVLLSIIPGSGGSGDSAFIEINARARFGYDSSIPGMVFDDNNTTKTFNVRLANIVRLKINPATNLIDFSAAVAIAGVSNIQQFLVTGYSTQAVATPLAQVTRADAAAGVSAMLGLTALGSGANGDGGAVYLRGKTSTTAAQEMARIAYLWNDATHATRKADLVFSAYDTAEREGIRIRGNGSEPAVGFYGVAPVARQLLATGTGASVDDVITALQALGLLKQA